MSVVDIFLELVQIDSLSFNELEAANYVINYLRQFGFDVQMDSANKNLDGNCGNVIGLLTSNPAAPTILFNAHLDTVNPGKNIKPIIENGFARSDGKTVLGADDKAGVAIILEAARQIVENDLPHGPIEIILTVAEEKGLLGSKNLDLAQIKADFAFVLDAEGKAGGLIVKAPSQNSIRAIFRGKSAHSGVNPEDGINSISAAAKAISYMNLGRLDFETTSNIGTIKGGLAPNIVPPKTVIEGEARSHSGNKLQAQTEHMQECIERGARDAGANVKLEVSRAYDAFALTEQDEVVAIAAEAIRGLKLEPEFKSSGGGSDANVFNKAGIPAINLSIGAENVHSMDERVAVKDLVLGVEIVLKIVREALKRAKPE